MISIEILVNQMSGLQRQDVERWIAYEWVRPDSDGGHYVFQDIDVARVRLIWTLRDDMSVNEEALPVVLSLLDQLYDLRRRLRDLGETLNRTAAGKERKKSAAKTAPPKP